MTVSILRSWLCFGTFQRRSRSEFLWKRRGEYGKPPAENLKDYKSNELIRERKFRNATEANYHVARALFFVALDS